MTELQFIANQLGAIRREEKNGRKFIVAPGVAIVEGVMNGELALADEFGKYPQSWDGRPIVIDHPKLHGQHVSANRLDVHSIGATYNIHLDGHKLKTEFWFDEGAVNAAGKDGKRLLKRLEDGEVIEVSTAYFRDLEDKPGVFNGRQYVGVQHNHRPDHIAVLLDTDGACSIRDGCGLPRVNNEGDDMADDTPGVVTGKEGLTLLQRMAGTLDKIWRKESGMSERIEKLAANEALPFDREALEDFSEEQLTALESLLEREPDGEPSGSQPTANEEEEQEPDTEPEPTPDPEPAADVPEWAQGLQKSLTDLEGAVKDLQANVNAGVKKEKSDIVGRLSANERCPLNKKQLEGMELDALKALDASYRPADFSGMGGLHSNAGEGDYIEAPMPALNGGGD